jgi:hypothetical protein
MKDINEDLRCASETVLQLEGLMNILSIINEETQLEFINPSEFLMSIQRVGQIGAKLAVEALEDISRAENGYQGAPQTNYDGIGLPELVSAVLTHSDAPEWFVKGIGELISDNNAIDSHSPEYIAVALGLEVKP